MLKCGLSEVDITPVLGKYIPGYFHERLGTSIKDPLYARGWAVESEGISLIIISLDALVVMFEDAVEIKNRVSEFTGLPVDHVMVSATHTHTGGPADIFMEGNSDVEYRNLYVQKAADAGIMAYQTRKPACVGFGAGTENGISFNRRYYMKDGSIKTNPGVQSPDIVKAAGLIDPDVTVIRVNSLEGQRRRKRRRQRRKGT